MVNRSRTVSRRLLASLPGCHRRLEVLRRYSSQIVVGVEPNEQIITCQKVGQFDGRIPPGHPAKNLIQRIADIARNVGQNAVFTRLAQFNRLRRFTNLPLRLQETRPEDRQKPSVPSQPKVRPAFLPVSRMCCRAWSYSSGLERCSSMRGGGLGSCASRRR